MNNEALRYSTIAALKILSTHSRPEGNIFPLLQPTFPQVNRLDKVSASRGLGPSRRVAGKAHRPLGHCYPKIAQRHQFGRARLHVGILWR